MNCEQTKRFMDDYSYGELEDSLKSRVVLHLRQCRECSGLLEELASEEKLYSSYAELINRELESVPLAWSKLRMRLEEIPSREVRWLPALVTLPRSQLLRQMLFAAALVLVSIAGTFLTLRHYGDGDRKASVPAGKTDSSFQSAMRSIERAEQEYVNAITILSALAEKRKAKLDSRLVEELERNLRLIDEAIAATTKAYRARPHDPDLAFYMLSAYRKKVDLLQELIS